MGLQFEYTSPELQVTYENAYLRIIKGTFNNEQIDLLVGVYANINARNVEKDKALNEKALKDKEIEIRDRNVDLRAAYNAEAEQRTLTAQLETDVTNGVNGATQDDLVAAQALLTDKRDEVATIEANLDQLNAEHVSLKTTIEQTPEIRTVFRQKYSFPMTGEQIPEGGLMELLYNRLKLVPLFSSAVDV